MLQNHPDAGSRSFVLLAPSAGSVPSRFGQIDTNACRYEDLLGAMQRLRGRIYRDDGAIEPYQLIDSRHVLPIDEESWHLLLLDARGEVRGCARYREHPNSVRFGRLGAARSALALCREQGPKLKASVEAELAMARQLRLPYVELGGWALDESIRGTTEALRMAMATYALAQALGGGVGISTVTQRHSSSSILRRLGGQAFECGGAELPAYYDPEYKCGMEILRFYSWAPHQRYEARVGAMRPVLQDATVVCGGAGASAWLPRRSTISYPPIPWGRGNGFVSFPGTPDLGSAA